MVFRATCGECKYSFTSTKIFDMILSNNNPPYNKSIKSFLICPACGCRNECVDKAYSESIGADVMK